MWYFLTFLGGMIFATIVLFIIGSATISAKQHEQDKFAKIQKANLKKNNKGVSKTK